MAMIQVHNMTKERPEIGYCYIFRQPCLLEGTIAAQGRVACHITHAVRLRRCQKNIVLRQQHVFLRPSRVSIELLHRMSIASGGT